ncbi:MAG: hypothetical protein AB3N11_16260 [Arenibacterium sp.]
MAEKHTEYRPAAWMMYISGLAHLAAPFLSGFSYWSLLLVPAGLFWFAAGYLLIRHGSGVLAGLLFVLALIGSIAGLDMALGNWPIAPPVGWVICLSDLGAALLLFLRLWPSKAAPRTG